MEERIYKDRIAELLLEAAKSDDRNERMAELSTEFCIALGAISLMVSGDQSRRENFLNQCAESMFDSSRELDRPRSTFMA